MTDREQVVTAVIAAAGGELTGKVRLQKVIYLLDQLGLNSGFKFEYYHYGPFSRDVVNATEDAKAFDLVQEFVGHRASDGAPFSVFSTSNNADDVAFGRLGKAEAEKQLAILRKEDATVLELAATAHWLWRFESRTDWKAEIVKRKGSKCGGGRLDKAVELLRGLELAPT